MNNKGDYYFTAINCFEKVGDSNTIHTRRVRTSLHKISSEGALTTLIPGRGLPVQALGSANTSISGIGFFGPGTRSQFQTGQDLDYMFDCISSYSSGNPGNADGSQQVWAGMKYHHDLNQTETRSY